MYELSIGVSRPHSQARLSKNSVQIINTLKSLLAVSQTAKRRALDSKSLDRMKGNKEFSFWYKYKYSGMYTL